MINNRRIDRSLRKIDKIQAKLQKIYKKTYQNILYSLQTSKVEEYNDLITLSDIQNKGVYNVYLIYDDEIVLIDNLILQCINDKLLLMLVGSDNNITLIDISAFINTCDDLQLLVMASYKMYIEEEII